MTRETVPIVVTRLHPSGMWECTAIIGNQRYRQRYAEHTKREAIEAFRADLIETVRPFEAEYRFILAT